MTKFRTFRRAAAAITVASGLLVCSAAGAGAAGLRAPDLVGSAHAEALRVSLTIPGAAALLDSLEQAGITLPLAVPKDVKDALPGVKIEQVFAMSDASVTGAKASGYAQPLGGLIATEPSVSYCAKSKCTSADAYSHSEQGKSIKNILSEVVEGGIGNIDLAGARSISSSTRDTRNATAVVHVDLTLQNLLKKVPQLDAALDQLYSVVNGTVVPALNGALDTVDDTIAGLPPEVRNALGDARNTLGTVVQTGRLNKIPDIRTVGLLDATVLPARADVVREGSILKSIGESKVLDVSVLGDWVTLKSVSAMATSLMDIDAQAKAGALPTNGTINKAAKNLASKLPLDASRGLEIGGLNFGGLLSVKVPESKLTNGQFFADLKDTLRRNAPAGTEAAVDKLVAALDLAYNTANVRLDVIKGSLDKGTRNFSAKSSQDAFKAGTKVVRSTDSEATLDMKAGAVSDMLRLTVAPRIPVFGSPANAAGLAGQAATLIPEKYVSTGIELRVDFPNAKSQVAQGAAVRGFHIARTGVGIPWIAAGALIGVAVLVRRFALSK